LTLTDKNQFAVKLSTNGTNNYQYMIDVLELSGVYGYVGFLTNNSSMGIMIFINDVIFWLVECRKLFYDNQTI
jgi:hypothetical protein